ncbi:hypothetical protein [Nostoc sp.]
MPWRLEIVAIQTKPTKGIVYKLCGEISLLGLHDPQNLIVDVA